MDAWRGWIRNGVLWALLGAAVLSGRTLAAVAPEAAAPPPPAQLIAPERMLAVDQVRPGMKGHGRSVFEGTRIESFGITVLGVLRKIDFGGDLILIRIDDGPPVTSGAGVSQGMSGSPIYVDGRLIGALAFAWPFAKQPVAGVTPIAQMLENYRPGSAPPAPVVARAGDLRPEGGPLRLEGHLFTRVTVVPDRAAASPAGGGGTLYLAPVATPITVSGMGRPALDELRRRFSRFPVTLAPGPGRAELSAGERPRIEPGAAVGVRLLGGDIDATAIGTVTYVDGDHVVAFGHPMFGLGSIDLPMTTAFIHGIIPTQEVSFKLGSPVETVGAVTQDRNWTIGGQLGRSPQFVNAAFSVRDLERGVRTAYRVEAAIHRDLTASLLYGALMSAVGSVSPPNRGTTRGVLRIWPRGMPVIERENLFAMGERRSALERLFGDPFIGLPMAELLQILDVLENNTFGSVPVDRLEVDVEVSEKRRTAAIERAYADRKRVKPGDRVRIGVVIQPVDAPKEVREIEVEIPRNIPGGRLQIGLAGGVSAERMRQYMQITRPAARTLSQLVEQITRREQNSHLTIEVAQPVAGISAGGREFPNLPNVVIEVLTGANPSGIRMIRSHTGRSDSTPWVLSGTQVLSFLVDADEKDKSGPALAPGTGGLGGFGSLLDIFRFGLGGEVEGDDLGDAGEGSLFDGAEEEGLIGGAASPGRSVRSAAAVPEDPVLPGFDELQRILDGEANEPGETGGSRVNAPQQGVARAPGVWRVGGARDFAGGKLEEVLVTSRGELALAPRAVPLLSSPDRFFWAQTTDGAGNVYVAGWLDGRILKIDAQGQPAEFFSAPGAIAVSALTSDPEGTLYAATEPGGTIYRITRDGMGAPLCRLPDRRIWVLRVVGGSVYAGTGSEGELYRISREGRAERVFIAPDRHILALVEDGGGGLYCGTYPRGKIFRLREGKAEPVYELPGSTVTALAADGKGSLYVGTSPRASVIRLSPTGDATTLFQSREKHVFSLLVDEAGYVYAGVGGSGKIYRIAPDRTAATLWEPEAAHVLSLTRDAGGNLYATTAGPTRIVRLGPKAGTAGTFTSRVLPAGNLARWGAIRWSGSGEGIRIQTRSGNTAYPDATWSPWSEPYGRQDGQPVASPAGHYLQYRVLLSSGPSTPLPTLRGLEIFYRPRNRAPEVQWRSPAAGAVLSGSRALRWEGKDGDGDRLEYDLYYQREGSDAWARIGSRPAGAAEDASPPAPETAIDWGPGKGPRRAVSRLPSPRPPAQSGPVPAGARGRARRAQATPALAPSHGGPQPAPGGELMGAEAEETDEMPDLEMPGGGGSLTWNTRRVPDGRYRLKIVAMDRTTSPDDPASAEAVSEFIRVDNTPPRLLPQLARRLGPAPPLLLPVRDTGTYVASAEFRVDGGEWLGAAAADGIFDSAEESIRIDVARLKPGRAVLEVRARDAAGNEAITRIPYVLPVGSAAGATGQPRGPAR